LSNASLIEGGGGACPPPPVGPPEGRTEAIARELEDRLPPDVDLEAVRVRHGGEGGGRGGKGGG